MFTNAGKTMEFVYVSIIRLSDSTSRSSMEMEDCCGDIVFYFCLAKIKNARKMRAFCDILICIYVNIINDLFDSFMQHIASSNIIFNNFYKITCFS